MGSEPRTSILVLNGPCGVVDPPRYCARGPSPSDGVWDQQEAVLQGKAGNSVRIVRIPRCGRTVLSVRRCKVVGLIHSRSVLHRSRDVRGRVVGGKGCY